MIFIALTFLAAFTIEALGTAVSVIGLSTLFGANPIIIALAVSLDLGKLVVVSLLYTYWKKLSVVMRSYALFAAVITMVITSAGAAGYLSGEFQKAILGTQEVGLKVDILKKQQQKYEERKKQIDDQVAQLNSALNPDKTSVNQRIRLMNQFKQEQADLTAKIAAIDKELPELQMQQIGVEAKAGPILYIAKAFDVPVEVAVKWVILMIIFVFDPLAVFLIIAGNFLIRQRELDKEAELAKMIDLDKLEKTERPAVPSPLVVPVPEIVEEVPAETAEQPPVMAGVEVTDQFVEEKAEEVVEPIKNPTIDFGDGNGPVSAVISTEVVGASDVTWPEVEKLEEQVAAQPTEEVVAEETIEETPQETAKETTEAPAVQFRDPAEQLPLEPLESTRTVEEQPTREQITLSTLGLVKPDPNTIVDIANGEEVGHATGIYMSGRTKT